MKLVHRKTLFALFFVLVMGKSFSQTSWRFAIVGDTHVGSSDTIAEMVPFMLQDSLDFVVFAGDLVEGGLGTSGPALLDELNHFKTLIAPLYTAGIPVYGIRGNHENDANNDINMWNNAFSGTYAFPQNGPTTETNLSYSFSHKNAKVIALDVYKNIHQVNQAWVDAALANTTERHVFVVGHEAAFKVFHADCLDDSLSARDNFWNSMKNAGVKVYFCGHDHFIDVAKVDDGDGNADNDIYQYLVGTGGGWLMSQYSNYNGENSTFSPQRQFHEMEYGYSVVEMNGDSNEDCDVTIRWKKRMTNAVDSSNYYATSEHVVHYSLCAASTNEQPEFTYQIAPNPVKDELFIAHLVDETVEIIDLTGKNISTISHSNGHISTTILPAGTYFIKGKHFLLRFVKVD